MRERNNYGYIKQQSALNPLKDAMSEEVWKNLDMTLQEKLQLKVQKNRLDPMKLNTDHVLRKHSKTHSSKS